MAKVPVYHLDECQTCAHRHICKFVDKIDKVVKNGTLPLDLHGASCHEFVPEDVIDENWRQYQDDYIEVEDDYEEVEDDGEEPLDTQHFIEVLDHAIAQQMSAGKRVELVYINRETQDLINAHFNSPKDIATLILTDNSTVAIRIDNTLLTGYFLLQVMS